MLRKRRNTIIFLIGLIVLVYFLFLKMTDSHNQSDLSVELEKRLSELKVEVVASDEALAKLEAQVVSLEKGEQLPEAVDDNKPIVISGNRVTKEQKAYDLATFSSSGQVCSLSEAPQPKTDVQMYNVIDSISFDDVDGGVWKQGYPIKVQDSQWTPEKPLKVFLIPHSHDDPGWLKTFDGYYSAQVKNILDNMVLKLRQHERMKFIYAEISFFSTWWKSATEEQKESVKRYISEGRFELVTGGWVMPDEAAAHYWAMLDQLIEGHSWIRDNLGPNVVPRSGWSIDPFGHSSTMPYILRQSGLRNMLVQRIHYSVKKYLSINKFLEFNWRQTWDSVGSTDILCHMMPFYSYDVPHTCGPDPKICCQFDFQRLPGSRLNCPWRKAPQPITDANVHERAATLLDQYRKKSSLYKSNVVLIPLGDDFRYDTPGEWDKQYTNYDKLFTYMNGKSEWNVKAQFATLSDYFNELRKESGDPELSGASLAGFPTLSGDFFTYADRADHYWSGYFTSRPFYKHWDRHLESTLRSSEIIFSLAQAKAHHNHINTFQSKELYEKLTYARRSLGLFQHHDGITGTAKTFVVADYSERMLRGWKSAHEVIKESAQLLLSDSSAVEQEVFDVDWLKDVEDVLETRRLISLSSGQRKELVIYNSSPHQRQEVVRVWVSRVPISVYDVTLQAVECQVSPYFDTETVVSNNKFKLSFLAKVPALGMVTYSLEASETNPCTIATVTYYNHRDSVANDGVFNPTVDTGDKLTIHNDQLEVELSTSSGMLLSMTDRKSNEQHPLEMSFIKYKSSKAKDHAGGAYLFIPTGSSQSVLQSRPLMRVIKGNLFHEVHTMTSLVEHTVRIVNTPGPESLGLEVVNIDTITVSGRHRLWYAAIFCRERSGKF
ncbi:MAN2A1 [Bugula neritina]|uniref:Alpha-mannosidase n=1 Tax=Bugula neritina TaxID=10212 RepID=A0A7J7JND7_BUGNE|nr:MAN2A1 [Bugula neritina]